MSKECQIGLIGFGNIGVGVVRTLHENAALIESRLGRALRITRIADLDVTTQRDAPYDPAIVTKNVDDLFNDAGIEIVIELIGGVEPARTLVERALNAGKHVVTANKALIATHGAELFEIAAPKNLGLLYEAAVGGGIPIIRALQQGLSANRIDSIRGIINGTCNYILTEMEDGDVSFERALKDAQKKGYAEPDPTFDIDGIDTAHKLAVLAAMAFGMDIRINDVWVEGIRAIQPVDIRLARELGYAIKLLGIAKRPEPGGAVEVRVHPTLLPLESQLAAVRGVYNAVEVIGEPIGPTLYYGQGAGPRATSSAVISDLMALAADGAKFNARRDARLTIRKGEKNLRPADELETHYYLRFRVADRPGTMAQLSQALADHDISIKSMIQHEPGDETVGLAAEGAVLTIVTHLSRENAIRQTLKQVAKMELNLGKPFVLRVEE